MVITVINTSGGVGKTTTVLAFSEIVNKKTLLIDASQETSLTAFFQLDEDQTKKHNFFTFLNGKSKINDCVIPINENIDLIPGSKKVSDDAQYKNKNLVSKKLSALPYSNIIFDTQPSFGYLNRSCISFSDLILVPCRIQLNYIESVLGIAKNVKKEIKVLPTMYKWWWPKEREHYEALEEIPKNIEVLNHTKWYLTAESINSDGQFKHKRLLRDYRNSIGGLI